MIATEQARTAPAANEMAHSSVTSAREQAPFTPTKFAYSQNQASMLIASVTCNLGEHERLAQGSLGRWLDMGTANQHVPSKCIVCDLSKMLFPHGSWELDATITPTQRAPVTMESKADTSQVISPITAAIRLIGAQAHCRCTAVVEDAQAGLMLCIQFALSRDTPISELPEFWFGVGKSSGLCHWLGSVSFGDCWNSGFGEDGGVECKMLMWWLEIRDGYGVAQEPRGSQHAVSFAGRYFQSIGRFLRHYCCTSQKQR